MQSPDDRCSPFSTPLLQHGAEYNGTSPRLDLIDLLSTHTPNEFAETEHSQNGSVTLNGISETPSSLKQLLSIQVRLQQLISPGSPSTSNVETRNPSLADVLLTVEDLIKILGELASMRQTFGSPISSQPWHGKGCLIPNSEEDSLIYLHTLTCYLYILQIFDSLTDALMETKASFVGASSILTRQSNLVPVFALGGFNPAPQPELNAEMSLYLIQLTVTKLHHLTHSTMPGRGNRNCALVGSTMRSATLDTDGDCWMLGSKGVVTDVIRLKEASVHRKLERR
ncbi:hypothetical protein FQN49_004968 [Arthroderma sp. PD_2]|nr:hypothetical protein FQN49_004968 [Arthroderma sp. PD_2]